MKSESACTQTAKTAPACPPHRYEYPPGDDVTAIGTCKQCGQRQISANKLAFKPQPQYGHQPDQHAYDPAEAFLRLEKGCLKGFEVGDQIPLVHTEKITHDDGKEITPTSRVTIIGRRSKHTDPHIINGYVAVGDDHVSRDHLKISYDGKHFVLKERPSGTPAGTYVKQENTDGDFKKIEPGTPHTLRDRDLIGIAKVRGDYRVLLRFRICEGTVIPFPETTDTATDGHGGGSKAGLEINLDTQVVKSNGKVVNLNQREWKLLAYLHQNKGKPCSQKDIIQIVFEGAVGKDSIKQIIHNIRKEIEPDPSHPTYIKNVRGFGYRLDL